MVLKTAQPMQFLEDLKAGLRKELLKEWKAQGHFMDGTIVNEMEFVINETSSKLDFLAYMFPYGGYIDTGVPAHKIPFSGIGGGGTSRYIQALIGYAKKRMNLPDKQAKSVAFAIAYTQKKEGMPTADSFKYSSAHKRTEWIEESLWRSREFIRQMIFGYMDSILRTRFEAMLTGYQKEFNKKIA